MKERRWAALLGPLAFALWFARAFAGTPVVVLAAIAIGIAVLIARTREEEQRWFHSIGRGIGVIYVVTFTASTIWIVRAAEIPLRHIESMSYFPTTAEPVNTYRRFFISGLDDVRNLRGRGVAWLDVHAYVAFEAAVPPPLRYDRPWRTITATEGASLLRNFDRELRDEPELAPSPTLVCMRAEDDRSVAVTCSDGGTRGVFASYFTR